MTSASFALEDLAARYWTFRCEEFPIEAILAGETSSSDLLLRHAPEDFERRAVWATAALDELAQLGAERFSPADRATASLLRGELTDLIEIVSHHGHLRPSIYPLGPEFLLGNWAAMTRLANAADAQRFLDRLVKIPAALEDVQRCMTKGRERGLRYPRLVVERAVSVVKSSRCELRSYRRGRAIGDPAQCCTCADELCAVPGADTASRGA